MAISSFFHGENENSITKNDLEVRTHKTMMVLVVVGQKMAVAIPYCFLPNSPKFSQIE